MGTLKMAPEVVSRLKPGTADRALLLLLDGRLFKCSCNVVSDLCLQHGATHVVPHLSDEAVGEKVPERRHVRYDTLHVSQPAMLAAVINERDAGLVRAPDHSPPTRSQARVVKLPHRRPRVHTLQHSRHVALCQHAARTLTGLVSHEAELAVALPDCKIHALNGPVVQDYAACVWNLSTLVEGKLDRPIHLVKKKRHQSICVPIEVHTEPSK
mmetsp:Transcript_4348/g.13149  ORF Transcript_4348/g.13149 Transcript_4348/m.13149 type:complete len:212 (-) Transcript_4348:311-946(-)